MSALAPSPRRRWIRRVILVAGVAALLLLARSAHTHLRAASLLLRFADENATGRIAELGKHAIDESAATVATSFGETRSRLYTPRGLADAPGVVVVHGVHRLGIDEPRLVRFARAIAATGVVVLTPEVKEIAAYTVDARSIDTIGAAARTLSERAGGKVGVMGMSFAGGLALLAAVDERYAPSIGFVVAVGAHHDLSRVARFFVTNRAERPDGSSESLSAHEYGALVLVHSHLEGFVPAGDVAIAREALRLWLSEQREAARERAKELGPEARALVEALFDRQIHAVSAAMVREMDRHPDAMQRVSPSGHLGALRVPVFLLHGAADSVIPAAETLWLARDVPAELLRAALVSPAIVHVEIHGDPALADKWDLVHFMAGVLDEASSARR